MNETLYQRLNQDVQRIIREAAKTIIVPAFHQYLTQEPLCVKADLSVVTKTDFETQAFLEKALSQLLPDSNFLGEEDGATGAVHEKAEWTWIVDPIDGTHNFAAHNIDFGVIVALWSNTEKKPKYGWIFLPMYDVMLSGGDGIGVYNNGGKIAPLRSGYRKPIKEMSGILNYTSFGEAKDIMRYNGQIFYEVSDSSCAALKFAEIILGKADFGAFGRAKLWDLCAGFALIDAIGGKAAKIDGSELVLKTPGKKPEWCLAVHDKATWNAVRDQLFRDVKTDAGAESSGAKSPAELQST